MQRQYNQRRLIHTQRLARRRTRKSPPFQCRNRRSANDKGVRPRGREPAESPDAYHRNVDYSLRQFSSGGCLSANCDVSRSGWSWSRPLARRLLAFTGTWPGDLFVSCSTQAFVQYSNPGNGSTFHRASGGAASAERLPKSARQPNLRSAMAAVSDDPARKDPARSSSTM